MPHNTIPRGRFGTEVEIWRERILDVAEQHFRRIGYQKTAVADIASCLGMSSANIYRYFPSRAAINESICERFVAQTIRLAAAVTRQDAPAHDKLRRLFQLLYEERIKQLVEEKHVHELIAVATIENWSIMSVHSSRLVTLVREIIEEGTEAGELSIDDAGASARGAMNAFSPFYHPILVEVWLRDAEDTQQHLDQQITFILAALGGHRGL